jgi:hypothetical protein
MRSKTAYGMATLLLAIGVGVAACSSSSGTTSSPPAFTNLAGTRWHQTDTVSGTTTCNVAIGVTDTFVLHVLSQSGGALSLYDERAGAGKAVNATMSGDVIAYSGTRYAVHGCTSMTGNYSVTVNAAETGYSGTATLTCQDNGCTVPVTVTATKM